MCGSPRFVLWQSRESEGMATRSSLDLRHAPLRQWTPRLGLKCAATPQPGGRDWCWRGKVVGACICPSCSPSSRPGALGRFTTPIGPSYLHPKIPFSCQLALFSHCLSPYTASSPCCSSVALSPGDSFLRFSPKRSRTSPGVHPQTSLTPTLDRQRRPISLGRIHNEQQPAGQSASAELWRCWR
jgi:hypothetical protein